MLWRIPSRPAIGRLLLDARGAVAWPSWLLGNQIEIRVIDAIGSHTPGAGMFGRVIDSGAIRPESVRLTSEGELSWDKDDATGRSAVSKMTYLAPFRFFEEFLLLPHRGPGMPAPRPGQGRHTAQGAARPRGEAASNGSVPQGEPSLVHAGAAGAPRARLSSGRC